MKLGDLIKQYRNEHQLSLREFATRCGLSHAYIDKLEKGHDPRTGKKVEPTLETLTRVSEAMGISLNDILTKIGYIDPQQKTETNIGKRLRKLRNEKKFTQKDVASFLNISDRTIGYYESGQRNPDPETLQKLADFFDVSVDYLLGRTDIKNPEESTIDDEISKIMKDLGPDITMQFYDLKGMTEEEKEDLKIFLQLLKEKRKKKNSED